MAQPVAALIVRVAADLADLKTGVAEVNNTLGGVTDMAKKAAGALAAAFSLREIGEAAGHAMEFAGHLDDLSRKAGISAEAVQELDFVAKMSGSSFDTVSGALAQMGKRLAGGKDSTVASLDALNLQLTDLQAMQPDKAFEAIATAIAAVPDPMQRSKLAMELFGKSGADLLPVLTSNIGALRKEAHDAGLVVSNELVAAGDAAGDNWDKMQVKLNALKADALLPVIDLFAKMPAPMQLVVAAGLQLGPSLSGIGVAIMAAGGPVAAFGLLSSAFAAVMPFLGPGALIVVGIVAIYEAWKHWDQITAIVQAVYTGVKTWLVDKFAAVVQSIKDKVGAVTGFFSDMYEKVVGHSYVPDMVTQIGQHFSRLDDVMITPAGLATTIVEGAFESMSSAVSGTVYSMLSSLTDMLNGWLDNFMPSWAARLVSGLAGEGMSAAVDAGLGALGIGGAAAGAGGAAAGGAAGAGSAGGAAAGVGAGIGLGTTLAITGGAAGGALLAWAIWKKGLFRGGDEALHVNGPRDQFFAQFGGYDGLAQALTALTDGSVADRLITTLYKADHVAAFHSAESAIADVFERAGRHVQVFHSGGLVLGNGEQSATLLGGEGVLSRRGMDALGELNRGRAGGADMSGMERRLDRLLTTMDRNFATMPVKLLSAVRLAR